MNPTEIGRRLDGDFRAACARLHVDDPWFGAFALHSNHKDVHYKVGERRHPDERIVDWRHPMAQAFYGSAPGELFELEVPQYHHLTGTTLYIGKCASEGRVLSRVELRTTDGAHVLVQGDDGTLQPESDRMYAPRPAGTLPDIRALLTPKQYALITSSRGAPVVIQGRAGSGKTTVALYRVSWLTYAAEEDPNAAPIDPSRVLIVMFNRALANFVDRSLAPLRLENAKLSTFHGWAEEAVKRAYNGVVDIDPGIGLPGRDEAVRIKKQIGILTALQEFVAEQTRRAVAWLTERLTPYHAQDLTERFRQMRRPVGRRLIALRAEALAKRNESKGRELTRWENIYKILQQGVSRFSQYKEELLRFLTDKTLLSKHLPDETPQSLDALVAFQTALQGAGGSDRRPGTKVAFEDLALLLRLIELKHGGLTDAHKEEEVFVYDHMVIDEVQDFGAVELQVLLDTVRSRTGVTIVGDHNQKIVPSADFMGWDKLIAELGVTGAAVTRLDVGHRSTAPIMAVADLLVGERSEGGRAGVRPSLVQADTTATLFDHLVSGLRADVGDNPLGHHCVVCRQPKDAKMVLDRLRPALADLGVEVRLGHNKEFSFGAGVTVTNLRQIKGLEFDSVVVVEASPQNYSDNEEGRRNLYTVITRAKDRLRLLVTGKPTELLRPALDAGLIEFENIDAIVPVAFSEDDEEPF